MSDLAGSLRSEVLRPSLNIVTAVDREQTRQAVWDLIGLRSKLLENETTSVPSGLGYRGTYLLNGRLLAHFPSISLSHGLSVPETGGFIDEDEVPPWDTWVYFVDDFLISWVPGNLESALKSAIDCNPEESLCWLSDVSHGFVDDVRREGLL